MMRASVFRLSPFLLLAAALVALAILFVHDSPPASADHNDIWSATLTVQDIIGTWKGCQEREANDCSAALTDSSFTYAGESYQVIRVFVHNSNNELLISLDKVFKADVRALDNLTLVVDGQSFPLASAVSEARFNDGDQATWANSGLSWSVGDTVEVSLTEPAISTVTLEYWSDTLSVKTLDYGFGCGYRTGQPLCGNGLGSNVFTYHGNPYQVEMVHVAYGDTLQLILNEDPKDRDGTRTERARMALNVGTGALTKQFRVKDAQVSYGIAEDLDNDGTNEWTNEDAWVLTWTNSGLSWAEGDSVSLSLVTLPAGGL